MALLFLLVVLAVGWLYRTEITRYVRGIVDPISLARRTGTPSPDALASAEVKVGILAREQPDSVLLTASELASLLSHGHSILGFPGLDSISIELGDRRVRVRTMVNTGVLPARILQLWPGTPAPYEEVIAEGGLAPARPGVAEWQLERVIVRGIPLPSDVVGRLVAQATGQGSDGRITLPLPKDVQGFRVRPEGVALFRSPAS
ncbi:MAG TPA: hypothetical protein VFN22_02820 [Gemmatimonadales bacterium]|nr:hypothetical protein [Gemmatimonadales bacterium]